LKARVAAALGAGLATLLAGVGCGRDRAPLPGPRLAAVRTEADLGPTAPGATVRHAFAVRNDGGRPLRLSALRTACDCRAIAAPGTTLAPGESGAIELDCTAPAAAGRQRRTVTVYSNDAARPALTLAVAMEVEAEVAPLQERFYFGRARSGERTGRDLRLRLGRAEAVPRRAASRDGNFEARLERRNDQEWRVALTVAPGTPPGRVEDVIVIETASERQPRLEVPVLGRVVAEEGR